MPRPTWTEEHRCSAQAPRRSLSSTNRQTASHEQMGFAGPRQRNPTNGRRASRSPSWASTHALRLEKNGPIDRCNRARSDYTRETEVALLPLEAQEAGSRYRHHRDARVRRRCRGSRRCPHSLRCHPLFALDLFASQRLSCRALPQTFIRFACAPIYTLVRTDAFERSAFLCGKADAERFRTC